MLAAATKRASYKIGCTIVGYPGCITVVSSFAGSTFESSARQRFAVVRLIVQVECIFGCNFEFTGYCSINLIDTLSCITDRTIGNCFGRNPNCSCSSIELEELVSHHLLQSQSSLLHHFGKLVAVEF